MPASGRTFRVFVSSTFSDLTEERNALQRDVFPQLREICRQNGCRFQAIDLRWGVREEAGLDQQTGLNGVWIAKKPELVASPVKTFSDTITPTTM